MRPRGQRLGGGVSVLTQYVKRGQAAVKTLRQQPALGQPDGQVGVGADQLDGDALVPVQGVDEVDEQRLPVGAHGRAP